MKFKLSLVTFTAFACVAASGLSAYGAVSLSLNDTTSGLITSNVAPGSNFTLSLKLTSVGDEVTGLNYSFTASQGGTFVLTSRNSQSVGSAFPDVAPPDSSIVNRPLNPPTALFGQTISDVTVPGVSNGTFEVADFLFTVGTGVSPGTYTISTGSNSTYNQVAPDFTEAAITSQALFTVVVVPEPSSYFYLLAGLIAMAALSYQRRLQFKK